MHITPSELRRINTTRVLSEIRRSPGISRSQLARRINFTDASLSRITKELIGAEMIVEREERKTTAGPGRPNIGLHVNPLGFTMLTVVSTSYEQKFSLVALDGDRLTEGELTLPMSGPEGGAASVVAPVQEIASKIEDAADARGGACAPPIRRVSAIYVIASDQSASKTAAMSDLAQELQRRFEAPVRHDSVTTALHVAESHLQAESPPRRSLLAHAGFDLGASLIMDGGAAGVTEVENALNFVPLSIAGAPGEPGAAGAWLRLGDISSGGAIMRTLGHVNPPGAADDAAAGLRLGLPHAVRQANAGDRRAVTVFADAGRRLGQALAALVSLTAPDRIFLAGPLAQTQPYFEGFCGPLRAAIPDADRKAVQRSRISYLQAAEVSGLQSFVFSKKGGGEESSEIRAA